MRRIPRGTTIITSKEAAEYYGCSKQRLHQLVADGRLRPLIHDDHSPMIFDLKDVEELWEEMEGIREAKGYIGTVREKKTREN